MAIYGERPLVGLLTDLTGRGPRLALQTLPPYDAYPYLNNGQQIAFMAPNEGSFEADGERLSLDV